MQRVTLRPVPSYGVKAHFVGINIPVATVYLEGLLRGFPAMNGVTINRAR